MGGKPGVLGNEELTWARDHNLQVSAEIYDRSSALLRNFVIGRQLQMCSRECKYVGVKYFHYYITDGTWTLEFGGGEVSNNHVEVHNRRMPSGALVEKRFVMNSEILQRMKQVVGATNYSLCLRNCEHIARYVHSGAWVCMQMLPNGLLHAFFEYYMLGESKKMINQIPEELRSKCQVHAPLYPGCEGFLKLISANKQGFSAYDEEAYNVVVIGPTGSGKSSVINRWFNKNVSKTACSVASVTREMCIFEGDGSVGLYRNGHRRNTKVNVIDTIGFCDSALKPDDVVRLIKHWLKVQRTTIDRVIVFVSGRIEETHASSIKDMMKWLNFEKHYMNFVFVYNKADVVPDVATITTNVAEMCAILDTGFKQAVVCNEAGQQETVDLNMPLGIPPTASYRESELAMDPLYKIAFLDMQNGRIPVDVSMCSVL